MPLSIDYRLGVDGSQGLTVLQLLQTAMKQTGEVARTELGQKLKTIFTVAAIEETVRRTAEWAQTIEQTSKQLGISAEALQTLKQIASKSGTPDDAVTGMFENIAKARDQAIAGNTELLSSFTALGVTISDLQTLTKEGLFSKTMSGINALAPRGVQNADMYIRQNVAAVTGNTPENYINAVNQTTNGNFQGYKKQGRDEGNILSEGTVSEIASTWTEIIQNLKNLGKQLSPLIVIILGLVNAIVESISGVIDIVSGIKDILSGNFKEGIQKIGGILLNGVFGIVKPFMGMFDFITKYLLKVGAFLHIPGSTTGLKGIANGGTGTAVLDKWQKNMNEEYGISDNIKQHGEGVGGVAAIIGTGGDALAAKLGSSVALKGASLLEKSGLQFGKEGLLNSAAWSEEYANRGGLMGIGRKMSPEEARRLSFEKGTTTTEFSEEEGTVSLIEPNIDVYNKALIRKMTMLQLATAGFTAAGAINNSINNGTTTASVTPILPKNYLMKELGGSKSASLAIGGTFGSGFSSRIIKLNEEMVRYLALISKSMTYNANPPTNPAPQSPGGL